VQTGEALCAFTSPGRLASAVSGKRRRAGDSSSILLFKIMENVCRTSVNVTRLRVLPRTARERRAGKKRRNKTWKSSILGSRVSDNDGPAQAR